MLWELRMPFDAAGRVECTDLAYVRAVWIVKDDWGFGRRVAM